VTPMPPIAKDDVVHRFVHTIGNDDRSDHGHSAAGDALGSAEKRRRSARLQSPRDGRMPMQTPASTLPSASDGSETAPIHHGNIIDNDSNNNNKSISSNNGNSGGSGSGSSSSSSNGETEAPCSCPHVAHLVLGQDRSFLNPQFWSCRTCGTTDGVWVRAPPVRLCAGTV
jgi:hypothetical protein